MTNRRPHAVPAAARLVALIILLNMGAMAALAILIATRTIPIGPLEIDKDVGRPLEILFLLLGLGAIGLSHVFRKIMLMRAEASPDPARGRYAAVIASMAFGEMPATLALVNAILTHNPVSTALLGAAAVVTGLLHFPRTGGAIR